MFIDESRGGDRLIGSESSPDGLLLKQEYIRLKGGKICLATWGERGRPVVFLVHGLQSHAGLWDKVAAEVARRGFYVVAPDRRGHGYSDWFQSYNLLDYSLDIRAILDQVTSEPVTMAGHCESTLVVSMFAAAFPKSVKKLVLIQFPDLSRRVSAETCGDLLRMFLQKHSTTVAGVHPVFSSADEATKRLLQDAPFAIPEAMARRVTPRNIKPVSGGVSWRWDPAILHYRLTYDLFDVDLLKEMIKRIEASVTPLYGRESSLVCGRGGRVLELCRTVIPHAPPRLVPGGHYPHMENVLSEDLLEALT